MKNLIIARFSRSDGFAASGTVSSDRDKRFTPGQFFRELGTLIAVCLALGVLAQLLVG